MFARRLLSRNSLAGIISSEGVNTLNAVIVLRKETIDSDNFGKVEVHFWTRVSQVGLLSKCEKYSP
ncbi:MAG TPA: hypothetical protein VK625_22445 [Flavitalea sp.]|nr:hypothetical protein [Flavitalea sp.]